MEPTRRPLEAVAAADSQADRRSHPGRPVVVVGGTVVVAEGSTHPDCEVDLRADPRQ